jgi:hypothetical protein
MPLEHCHQRRREVDHALLEGLGGLDPPEVPCPFHTHCSLSEIEIAPV